MSFGILPRYLLRQFLPVFFLCLTIFTGVLLMNHFLRLFNMAVMKGISLFWIAGCFARLLPYLCSLAVPMAFLVALMVCLGQLSESGEVTALRASGFSFTEMSWPFLALGVLLSGLLFFLNHKAAPEGFHSFRKQYVAAAQQIARIELQPGSFMKLGPWRLYARQASRGSDSIEGVYLVRSEISSSAIRISARRGRLHLEKEQGVELELLDGDLQLPNHNPERFTAGHFERYTVAVPLAGVAAVERELDIPEISSRGLKARMADPKTTPQHRLEYVVELTVRSAAALSPFVFFWIAAPLGLKLGKHSRGVGFAASLGVMLAFYGLLAAGIGVGRRHESLARVAPWAADVAGLILGAVLTRRVLLR